MTEKVVTEDGREFEKPEKVKFVLHIGKHRNNSYITDELMTVTTPTGWFTGDKIPENLRRYCSNPNLETKQGDIRKWKIPAGQHIKPDRFRNILEKDENIEITKWNEKCGDLDQTRIELEVKIN